MNNEFIKTFGPEGRFLALPDNSYWLSREELILSYLHQRNAPVPRVEVKNLREKSLTLENVGLSLDHLHLGPQSSQQDTLLVFRQMLASIEAYKTIHQLGVLHLDIAARNIASTNEASGKIHLLDFSHALSVHNKLQKPLPLLPRENLHHPLLVEALRQDWANYFQHLDQSLPDLDGDFSISDEEFSAYWADELQVQKLCGSKAVLCHGIGNFLREMAQVQVFQSHQRDWLVMNARELSALDESAAEEALQDVTENFSDMIAGLENVHANVTPIPGLIKKPVEKQAATQATAEIKPPETKAEAALQPSPLPSLQPELTVLPALPASAKTSPPPIGSFAETIMWLALVLNGYWIDIIVETANVALPDWLLLALMATVPVVLPALLAGLLLKPHRAIRARIFAAIIITAAEGLLIFQYPVRVLEHTWSWAPSLLAGLFVLRCIWKMQLKKDRLLLAAGQNRSL